MVGERGSVTLREVARAWYLQPQHLPPDVDPGGLDVTAGYKAGRDSGTFSYAAHAAIVSVDPETGLVEVLDYVVVEDGGTLINPMIVDGQIMRRHGARHRHLPVSRRCPFDAQGQPLAIHDAGLSAADARPRCPTSACCTWRRRRPTPSSA